ncbi:ArsA family ATPase [Pseudidiomarina terrestris]|uniref:ArsA family ATPase n=1 Tax=Pseudidiomarina terrestris TaxID=2820060 RepID=UPI00264CFDD3|nr:ArsA family ATPase [Pseudidiomarina sp. 1ASP75-5]MDN7135235.1 ArsA family ATPase [Pseudidiomarina sp. 1ASP75-5]
MAAPDFLAQLPPIVFIGGKGGVGKTSVASALALKLARSGKRVLIVSTDPAHSLSDAFDIAIGGQTTTIESRLDALEIDPDQQVKDHIESVLASMKDLVKPTLYPQIEKQMKLTAQSPGTQEAALLESIAKLIDQRTLKGYDHILFDTAPTGHTLRLLILPEAMSAWTQGLLQHSEKAQQLQGVVDHLASARQTAPQHPLGEPKQHGVANLSDRNAKIAERLRERQQLFQRVRSAIKNADETAIILVLTPEKLPILETERAVQQLHEHKLPLAALIVNRNLPDPVEGEFLLQRKHQEGIYQQQIEQRFSQELKTYLPLFPTDLDGVTGLEKLLQALKDCTFQASV